MSASGAGRFASDIDDVGAGGLHLEGMRNRPAGVEVAAAIGERIGRNIEDAHHGRQPDHDTALQPES